MLEHKYVYDVSSIKTNHDREVKKLNSELNIK